MVKASKAIDLFQNPHGETGLTNGSVGRYSIHHIMLDWGNRILCVHPELAGCIQL